MGPDDGVKMRQRVKVLTTRIIKKQCDLILRMKSVCGSNDQKVDASRSVWCVELNQTKLGTGRQDGTFAPLALHDEAHQRRSDAMRCDAMGWDRDNDVDGVRLGGQCGGGRDSYLILPL